jgi:hypothetical protein
MHGNSYRNLVIELIAHFTIMYLVMYTMIAAFDHFYFNLNNVYMTLMMVTPMALLMLVLMPSMYGNKRANLIIAIGAVVIFAGSFYAMRSQAAIGDKELIRGMIPHHSGAILMCGKAKLTDPELITLCDEIIDAQEREIAQMQAVLERL